MPANESRHSITISLSPAQVDEVVRAAAGARVSSVSALVAGALADVAGEDGETGNGDALERVRMQAAGYMPGDIDDARLSRSLVRGISILAYFGSDGRERGIVELAEDLGMSPSTAHRYALTLVELGLLERSPRTRKYRLPGVSSAAAPRRS